MSILDSTQQNEKIQPLMAAVYCRVSTGRQENEATIESQMDETCRKVKSDGNILLNENIFSDDGWTGEMLARPSMDEMRTAALEGKFQVLYVYDRGRIARDFGYQEVVLKELEDLDIKFESIHDIAAITAEQKVMQSMQGVFHEYEKVKIAERMRRGKLFKAKAGVLINGHSLYGYNYIKKTETIPAHCNINEEEARTVNMIFEWVGVDDMSIRGVIRKLYELGIPPRKQKSEFWTKGPIIRLLQNEAYSKGVIYFNKSQAIVAKNPTKNIKYKRVKKNSRAVRPRDEWLPFKVPTILEDNGLYEKVQLILEQNKKYRNKRRRYEYLLSGKLFCECGNPRVGDGCNANGHHYYRCSERVKKILPGGRLCKAKGINAEALDIMFWNKIAKFLKHPDLLQQASETFLKNQNSYDKRLENEAISIESMMGKLDDEQNRYIKAYGSGLIGDDQLRDSMLECRKRRVPLQKQLDSLKNSIENQSIPSDKVKDLCQEAKNVLESLDATNKTKVVRELVEKIVVESNQKVVVWGHVPILTRKLEYEPIYRNCRTAKRWQINPF